MIKTKEESPVEYQTKNNFERYQEIKLTMEYNQKIDVKIHESKDAHAYFRKIWNSDIGIRERMYVVYLNQQNIPIGWYELSAGGIASTVVDRRLLLTPIYAEGAVLNAVAIFIAHNHPSGNLNPSKADIDITNKIKEMCKLHDVAILDHLILIPDEAHYYSMADEQLI
jgi:DNA repair protein RadC